jgi:hypothetical protein
MKYKQEKWQQLDTETPKPESQRYEFGTSYSQQCSKRNSGSSQQEEQHQEAKKRAMRE